MAIKEVSKGYNTSQGTLRYYERMGMTPLVTHTSGGIRDYQEEDLWWVQPAICMRGVGFLVEVMIEHVKPYSEGGEAIPVRLQSLNEQRGALLEQRRQIDETINRLNYRIERYEAVVRAGVLPWDEDDCPTKKMQ